LLGAEKRLQEPVREVYKTFMAKLMKQSRFAKRRVSHRTQSSMMPTPMHVIDGQHSPDSKHSQLKKSDFSFTKLMQSVPKQHDSTFNSQMQKSEIPHLVKLMINKFPNTDESTWKLMPKRQAIN
jgi:hypothetical protein